MASPQPVLKRTYDDYRNTPPDQRFELLDGDLLMTPAPNLKHQETAAALAGELIRFVRRHALGKVYCAPCDVVLSDTDVVQPDLLFVARDRLHLLANGENVQGAPDLVVEILSPSTADRDRGYKRELYARHGVREYWIVDPDAETIHVLRQHDGGLEEAHTFDRTRNLHTALLPGFEVDLRDIFA